jgi:hypothetical protein
MLSPFAGISLITHLLICFLYKTALFFYGLFGGFKGKKNTQLTLLIRARDEKILPPMIIGSILFIIMSLAVFSMGTVYQSKPNTFDLIANALDTTQTYEAPKVKSLLAQKNPPAREENSLAAAKSF